MCAYCCSIHEILEVKSAYRAINSWKDMGTVLYTFLFSHKSWNHTVGRKINWIEKCCMWSNQGSDMPILDSRFFSMCTRWEWGEQMPGN